MKDKCIESQQKDLSQRAESHFYPDNHPPAYLAVIDYEIGIKYARKGKTLHDPEDECIFSALTTPFAGFCIGINPQARAEPASLAFFQGFADFPLQAAVILQGRNKKMFNRVHVSLIFSALSSG